MTGDVVETQDGADALQVNGRDIPIDHLRVLNERVINFATNNGFRKIVASIGAIGLIEPLSVYAEGGGYVILDGFLRYTACKQLGITTVPCMVYRDKQAYTYNRNVNRLSAYQEIRMLRKSLETVDENTIAQTFGMKSMRSRLIPNLVRQLHPDLVEAFKANVIGKVTATELMRVTHDRQVEIYDEMRRMDDYSPAFCRALVIQTPAEQRNKAKRQQAAWAEDGERKRHMMERLAHAEKQHDFYAQLYRQYSADLLKATFYVRKLIAHPRIGSYLATKYPEIAERFRSVVDTTA